VQGKTAGEAEAVHKVVEVPSIQCEEGNVVHSVRRAIFISTEKFRRW